MAYCKNPDIVFRRIADELILVPIRQSAGDMGNIYTLNEVGARVWELIDGKRTVREIQELIVNEFEVSPESAEEDLKEFLRSLESIQGIKEA